MESAKGEITQLLQRWRGGDGTAESQIFEKLLPELHKIALSCFRRERAGATLQPTVLISESFLRLAAAKNIDWQDRGHFLAMSARIMRRYLIDHARSRPDIQFLPMEGIPERVVGKRSELELAVLVDKLLFRVRETVRRPPPSSTTRGMGLHEVIESR